MSEIIVTMPPEVVRIRASSTVFVKASSLVNLDFAGIVKVVDHVCPEKPKVANLRYSWRGRLKAKPSSKRWTRPSHLDEETSDRKVFTK